MSTKEPANRPRSRSRAQIILALIALLVVFGLATLLARPTDPFSSADLQDRTRKSDLSRPGVDQNGELLSAFYGLDDSRRIRWVGFRLCNRLAGADGMPLVFSKQLDVTTIEAGDITVWLRSGDLGRVDCVTLRPASEPGELRTLLLIGDFGSASEDPPARVEVTGNLHALDESANFRGASVAVTPLAAGPSLKFAQVVPKENWQVDQAANTDWQRQENCPQNGLQQIIRVTWNGGIVPTSDVADTPNHAQLYQVTLQTPDGTVRTVQPFAIGDLADNDNNHDLCLDVEGEVQSVFFPGGHVVDPNQDANADSVVTLTAPIPLP